MKVKGAIRLGIDLDTIHEINEVNKGKECELDIDLPIDREDLEEGNSENTHWKALRGIVLKTGKLYDSLSSPEKDIYREYLMARPDILDGKITFIGYLRENRIELNTVLAAIKPEAFWNWLKWKMLQVWPERDYRRGGLMLDDPIRTPTLNRFISFYEKQTESITKNSLDKERDDMSRVRGLYDDVDGFRDNVQIIKKVVQGDLLKEVILPDKTLQKIDLALEKIMKDDNGKSKSKSETKEVELDDNDNEDDDGNEWKD